MTTYTEHDFDKAEELKREILQELAELKAGYQVVTAIIVRSRLKYNLLARYGFIKGVPVYIWPVMEDNYSILTK